MGTKFQRSNFWDRLGGQLLLMIGLWLLWIPLTNHKYRASTKTIPETFALKASNQPHSFSNGHFDYCSQEIFSTIQIQQLDEPVVHYSFKNVLCKKNDETQWSFTDLFIDKRLNIKFL